MRKSIISLLLLFMCLPFVNATDLRFNLPINWEYTSTQDGYEYTIVNTGEEFEGSISLCAKDEAGNIFELFKESVAIAANSEAEYVHYFTNEIQLEEGEYAFFFKYEGSNGRVVIDEATQSGAVKAPSSITRIPITTTTDPGKLNLSSNTLRSQSQVSVYSTVELEEVSVINMVGSKVCSKKVHNEKEVELNVDGLGVGTYLIVGKTQKGVLTAKMLKIK